MSCPRGGRSCCFELGAPQETSGIITVRHKDISGGKFGPASVVADVGAAVTVATRLQAGVAELFRGVGVAAEGVDDFRHRGVIVSPGVDPEGEEGDGVRAGEAKVGVEGLGAREGVDA